MVDEEKQEQEEKTETPEVAEDQREPSDPDNLRPADVPPEPLTRREYSETEAPEAE
ncbi:MAG TPA: hypothetical protein VH187_05705 [Scandinavium sp.]|jgi:hypothetical protein|uniref:hypothetical protein n=1 Tax=Scandinavium sp. TaxID=2830653 RepID=UPI002E326FC2|nr:hypothetical protein [Scandinavium sp.]HEX4500652.1 hypothetical protein [Scandinavium sp.]